MSWPQQQQPKAAANEFSWRHLQVVHCDVKTQNVLLTENWETAKIADVGVAQLLGNYNPDNVGWTFACAPPAGCILFTASFRFFRALICSCFHGLVVFVHVVARLSQLSLLPGCPANRPVQIACK